MTVLAGFVFSNFRRSCMTASLMVIKASQLLRKYFVKGLSPGLFSWCSTLSVIAIIFVLPFLRILLKIVPSAGPINGNQYLTTTRSGISSFRRLPITSQLSGFTELIEGCISIPIGGGSEENCVLPGKRKSGYCNEKE